MVHNNKVLTVSYGTFSCTLEGFEDSFDTMKAIAEYFRDLASDDRYFGAEPPQPDADMLARIAQREVTRRVEAHSTDTGTIVLRATTPAAVVTDTAVPAPVTTPAKAPIPESNPPPEPVPDAATAPYSEPVPEPEAEPVTEPAAITADAAEHPAIPAEVVNIDAPAPVEPEIEQVHVEEPVETTAPAKQVSDDNSEIDAAKKTAEIIDHAADAGVADTIQGPADTAIEVVKKDAVDDENLVETGAPVPSDVSITPKTIPAVDSIAAKLQRIRAVVSQNDSLAQMDDYTEDQHADGFVAATAEDITPTKEPVSDAMAEEKIQNIAGNDIPNSEDQISADPSPDADTGVFEDQTDGDQANPESAANEVDNAAKADIDAGVETDTKPPLQARVVKVKRSEVAAVIASGQLEQGDNNPADDDPGDDRDFFLDDAAQDSSLSPEDEADLLRELANVENELASGDNDADDDANSDIGFEDNIFNEVNASQDDDDFADDANAALQQKVDEDEADLSRLMNEADEKLDDPETSSRHETYSQLRGAVAVAEAEHSAGGSIGGASGDEAYRDDLAEVVRPRRPAIDGARPSRPVIDARPAPLKLVAEQRVDTGTGIAQRGPVRPRRVMTSPVDESGAIDATTADSEFADFAARMGATELPDLLEAAAAYLSFVEGHDKFSRPQLMNKVRLIQQDNYNREDGLRSFGQLLRDGKIKKKGGGRFAASGEIGFQPDGEREAG